MNLMISGDLDKAKSAVRWLNDNVARNNRAELLPGYSSFLNDTVRWDAADASWYVSCKPRKGTIDIKMPDNPYTKAELILIIS